jgi:hypothetical protein
MVWLHSARRSVICHTLAGLLLSVYKRGREKACLIRFATQQNAAAGDTADGCWIAHTTRAEPATLTRHLGLALLCQPSTTLITLTNLSLNSALSNQ